MCIYFSNLNSTYPKDMFLIPNIDHLIGGSSSCKTLSFMDAYSRYNQINMNPMDAYKIVFISIMSYNMNLNFAKCSFYV